MPKRGGSILLIISIKSTEYLLTVPGGILALLGGFMELLFSNRFSK